MKNVFFILLTLLPITAFGQLSTTQPSIERKGFVFGFGIGGGFIHVSDSDQENPFDDTQGVITFPNIKIGWMLNDRLALLGLLPSMNYQFEDKDRSFNAFIPSVQYWVRDRWWVNGGLGLAMDFPALYEVDEVEDEDWNFGMAASISTGYELVQKKRYAMDLQTMVHLGRSYLGNDEHRDAIAFSIGLGFNWY